MPRRCSVGARFSSTGWFWMISSRMSQTSGRSRSTSRLAALHRLHEAAVLELADDERLEQLERHVLRQAALVELELGTDHDDRAARVVHALAEQVLAEAALLALEHVRQRLERTVALAAHGATAAAVVEQRVDGLLQHALLVAEDHLGGADLDQLLEPVVAVDHAAVEVVQVRRGEAAALERHQRTQVRRQHRDDLEDHPLGAVLALAERLDDAQPLEHLLLPLDRRLVLDLARSSAERSSRSISASRSRIASAPILATKARPGLLGLDLQVLVLGDDLLLLQARSCPDR